MSTPLSEAAGLGLHMGPRTIAALVGPTVQHALDDAADGNRGVLLGRGGNATQVTHITALADFHQVMREMKAELAEASARAERAEERATHAEERALRAEAELARLRQGMLELVESMRRLCAPPLAAAEVPARDAPRDRE